MSVLVTAEALSLNVPSHPAPLFGPLSFTIRRGDSLRLAGPSGAGKTVLLRHIAGLPGPVSGRVTQSPGLRIGFVFAEPRLIPGLSAAENIALVMARNRGADIRAALAELQLSAIADVPAMRLSKGQAQRIALLRALAILPDLLLLDEAASGLDDESWGLVSALVTRRRAEAGFALVETSHDPQRLFAPDAGSLVLAPPDGAG